MTNYFNGKKYSQQETTALVWGGLPLADLF